MTRNENEQKVIPKYMSLKPIMKVVKTFDEELTNH